jgi:hypothetical protein
MFALRGGASRPLRTFFTPMRRPANSPSSVFPEQGTYNPFTGGSSSSACRLCAAVSRKPVGSLAANKRSPSSSRTTLHAPHAAGNVQPKHGQKLVICVPFLRGCECSAQQPGAVSLPFTTPSHIFAPLHRARTAQLARQRALLVRPRAPLGPFLARLLPAPPAARASGPRRAPPPAPTAPRETTILARAAPPPARAFPVGLVVSAQLARLPASPASPARGPRRAPPPARRAQMAHTAMWAASPPRPARATVRPSRRRATCATRYLHAQARCSWEPQNLRCAPLAATARMRRQYCLATLEALRVWTKLGPPLGGAPVPVGRLFCWVFARGQLTPPT